jgi:rare lipoprotein A
MAAMRAISVAAAGVLLLALSACSRTSARGRPPLEPPFPAEALEVFQTGIASWYGVDFHGKTTANGEVYDMHRLTAAHQNLPFHTLVEVENLENGKRTLVRINDRGPFLKERVIDLSLKAAQRLGMEVKGTAEVALRVVRWGGWGNAPRPFAGQAASSATAGDQASGTGPNGGKAPDSRVLPAGAPEMNRECFVQVGAFSLWENAEGMRLTLEEIFPQLAFRVAAEGGLFKVISPGLESAVCRDVLKKLAAYRLQGFIRETGISGEN